MVYQSLTPSELQIQYSICFMRLLFYALIILNFSSCYLTRAYKYRKLELNDVHRMPSVTIPKSDEPYYFTDGTKTHQYENLNTYLDTNLAKSRTAAFIVIRNDSILYERYFNGFTRQSNLPSFSVAKSFVSTLIAIAAKEGKILSLQEPISTYFPELYKKDKRFSNITIQHLLDMRSGLHFREGTYNLKDDAIKLGFRPNLLKHALKVKIEKEPGEFKYQSINTELLALIIERATGKKISDYLHEKLWQPLGAEYSATWNVDSKRYQQEIAFAGLNATARDFAKLGQLFLQHGKWRDKQLVPASWINTINNADSMQEAGGYKNQWWSSLNYKYFKDSMSAVAFRDKKEWPGPVRKTRKGYVVGFRTHAFSAEGILNQTIYINPSNKVVIVRLGHSWYHPDLNAEQFIYNLGLRL